MKKNKGFSLVELIIVIAIMAILAAAIAPALIRYIDKSRKADDVTAAGTIATAVNTSLANEAAYDAYAIAGDNVVLMTASATVKGSSFSWVATGTYPNGEDDVFEKEVNSNLSGQAPQVKYKKDAGKGKPQTWAIKVSNDKPIVLLSTDTNNNYELSPTIDPSYQ